MDKPRIVDGRGVRYLLDDGRWVFDATDIAAALGHAHPEVLREIQQFAAAPVLNDGLLWEPRELAKSELLRVAFAGEEWAGSVWFCTSGSEANDLALSLARTLTGRQTLAARPRAYHGGSGLARDVTQLSYWDGGLVTDGAHIAARVGFRIRQVPGPAAARIDPSPSRADPAPGWRAAVGALTDVAAVILDYSQRRCHLRRRLPRRPRGRRP